MILTLGSAACHFGWMWVLTVLNKNNDIYISYLLLFGKCFKKVMQQSKENDVKQHLSQCTEMKSQYRVFSVTSWLLTP